MSNDDKSVSVVMTSYKRPDLLIQTVESFLKLNAYPITKFIIIDDSDDSKMEEGIIKKYGHAFELIFNKPRLGQIKSIDKAYAMITTPYIFHTEEDYVYQGNKDFIKDSIEILEENPTICQVHIKKWGDYGGPSNPYIDQDSYTKTSSGLDFCLLKRPHEGNWHGFSFNPGVRRLADYKRIFPEGYQKHIKTSGEDGCVSEYYVNVATYESGMTGSGAVLLDDKSACVSVGQWFSTYRKKGHGGIL